MRRQRGSSLAAVEVSAKNQRRALLGAKRRQRTEERLLAHLEWVQAALPRVLLPSRREENAGTGRQAKAPAHSRRVLALAHQRIGARIAGSDYPRRFESEPVDVQLTQQRRGHPGFVVTVLDAEVFRVEALERNAVPDVEEFQVTASRHDLHGMQSMVTDHGVGPRQPADGARRDGQHAWFAACAKFAMVGGIHRQECGTQSAAFPLQGAENGQQVSRQLVSV